MKSSNCQTTVSHSLTIRHSRIHCCPVSEDELVSCCTPPATQCYLCKHHTPIIAFSFSADIRSCSTTRSRPDLLKLTVFSLSSAKSYSHSRLSPISPQTKRRCIAPDSNRCPPSPRHPRPSPSEMAREKSHRQSPSSQFKSHADSIISKMPRSRLITRPRQQTRQN